MEVILQKFAMKEGDWLTLSGFYQSEVYNERKTDLLHRWQPRTTNHLVVH